MNVPVLATESAHSRDPECSQTRTRDVQALEQSLNSPSPTLTHLGSENAMPQNALFRTLLMIFDSIVLICARHRKERANHLSCAGGRVRRAHLAGKNC